ESGCESAEGLSAGRSRESQCLFHETLPRAPAPDRDRRPFLHETPIVSGIEPSRGAGGEPFVDALLRQLDDEISPADHREDLRSEPEAGALAQPCASVTCGSLRAARAPARTAP